MLRMSDLHKIKIEGIDADLIKLCDGDADADADTPP